MTSSNGQQQNDMIQSVRNTLQNLQNQRDNLRLEAEIITSELVAPFVDSNGKTCPPMGIDTPLVDPEGYPRGDIDVFRARTLRNRLARIRTDAKEIATQIEAQLHQLSALQNPQLKSEEEREMEARKAAKPKPKFDPVTGKWVVKNWDGSIAGSTGSDDRKFDSLEQEQQQSINSNSANNNNDASSNTVESGNEVVTSEKDHIRDNINDLKMTNSDIAPLPIDLVPFIKVAMVEPGSPADQAGLKVDDLILQWGDIKYESISSTSSTNDTALAAVAQLVHRVAAQNGSIAVWVERKTSSIVSVDNNIHSDREQFHLTITPRPWQDRGLLGCRIVPC